MLKSGRKVDLGSLGTGSTGEYLGSGGQGSVQRVHTATRDLALKWYADTSATIEQRVAIEELIAKGSPGPRFVWPEAIATIAGTQGFGYAMDLLPSGFVGLGALLDGHDKDGNAVDPDYAEVIRFCLELTRAFQQLHHEGLCYRDINLNNLFFDPGTGDVRICDCDNVGIDDGTHRIQGTFRFAAPEVVRGQAVPSAQTDLFSLAVALFCALMIGDPLEGEKTDLTTSQGCVLHLGTDPVFVFDPSDGRNRPLPSSATPYYWTVYPRFVRDLFLRSFTSGLTDPEHGRVRLSEWIVAMRALRNQLMTCPLCHKTIFWDFDEPSRPCHECHRTVDPPDVLVVGSERLVLDRHFLLLTSHFDWEIDHQAPVARATSSPDASAQLGIVNLSGERWEAAVGRTRSTIDPGQAIAPAPGLVLRFPKGEGTVRRGLDCSPHALPPPITQPARPARVAAPDQ